MMWGNYYINITLHFLYFYLTITMRTGIMYQHNDKYMHYDCIMYPLLYIMLLWKWIQFNQMK